MLLADPAPRWMEALTEGPGTCTQQPSEGAAVREDGQAGGVGGAG